MVFTCIHVFNFVIMKIILNPYGHLTLLSIKEKTKRNIKMRPWKKWNTKCRVVKILKSLILNSMIWIITVREWLLFDRFLLIAPPVNRPRRGCDQTPL